MTKLDIYWNKLVRPTLADLIEQSDNIARMTEGRLRLLPQAIGALRNTVAKRTDNGCVRIGALRDRGIVVFSEAPEVVDDFRFMLGSSTEDKTSRFIPNISYLFVSAVIKTQGPNARLVACAQANTPDNCHARRLGPTPVGFKYPSHVFDCVWEDGSEIPEQFCAGKWWKDAFGATVRIRHSVLNHYSNFHTYGRRCPQCRENWKK